MRGRDKLALILTDFLLTLLAAGLAIGLRLDNFNPEPLSRFLEWKTVLAVLGTGLFTILAFGVSGLYEKVWRYAGTHELVSITGATLLAVLPAQAAALISGGAVLPRTTPGLMALFTVVICGGVRLALRVLSESMGKPITSTRVLIVGANDAGETVLRELLRGRKPYVVVGFVDDRPDRRKVRIRGVPVLGRLDDLPGLMESNLVKEVLLAEPRPADVRRVMELTRGREVELRVVPAMGDLVTGQVQMSRLRELSIEDLLEREPVRVDAAALRPLLHGRRILITGAGGSIGSEIARQVSSFGPEQLILVGRGENSLYEVGLELPGAILRVCDVCRERIFEQLVGEFKPHVVFHAAAHKHVPMMENAPAEAVYTNVFGTLSVLNACRKHGVEHFTLLSTDKAVNPGNVMGATKRLAERLVARMAHPGYVAVRFGNVLGSRGSVVPTMRKQIAQGGPVTVTDPAMTRYFMTIPEAVTLVLQASSVAQGGEIYLLDMGKPVRILDLAHNLIRLCGFEPGVDVAVQITGCRPGEKLEEQLVGYGEHTEGTALAKIQRVVSAALPADWPGERLEALRQACLNGQAGECRALLGELLEWASGEQGAPAAENEAPVTTSKA